MKKLLSALSLLGLMLPFSQVAKANEYKFIEGKVTSNNVFEIYGVTLTGTKTLLKTFQGSDNYMSTSWEDGHVDEYEGKLFIDARDHNSKTGNTFSAPSSEYLLEYDLVDNTFTKRENMPDDLLLYPEGVNEIIRTDSTTGITSVGKNSLKLKETATEQQLWGTSAEGKIVPINITNGSKLLIDGRDVEQSINNVGALSAALTGLPTIPTDTTLACGLGTGTHGGDFAFSGGCASKVNDKLSINYAASMTMPGQDYAGDFEDKFSARAGFVWKLGKSVKPTLISMKAKEKMEEKIYTLEENNKKIISQNTDLKQKNQSIISQNKELLARLERLEKVALGESKSKDLATIKLP